MIFKKVSILGGKQEAEQCCKKIVSYCSSSLKIKVVMLYYAVS